ncbi:LemA family protein [Planctomicrobium sp. SH664]|uniref:LemA family protein n=1 Tax=Planctomicrobium sp. SH664 TaxID=3448125 RepID=UPI003F5CB195
MSTELAPVKRPAPWLLLIGGLVVVAIVAGLWFVSVGNQLVAMDEHAKTQWGQVETVLQRRFDLIPNLVNTVKGYASHEKEVLERVTELRSQWGAAKSPEQKAEIGGQLEGALSRLLLVAENYPELKADQGFRDLQVQLEGTENRISVERQRYNEVLRTYNTAVRTIPTSFVASMRGMTARPYFESAAGASEAPKVDFTK